MTQEMKGKEKMKNLFIADSGASCHLVGNEQGMYEWEYIDDDIVIGDGKSLRATKIGKLKMLLKQQDGSEKVVQLTGVKYVQNLGPYNLFSITQALSKGFKLVVKERQLLCRKESSSCTSIRSLRRRRVG